MVVVVGIVVVVGVVGSNLRRHVRGLIPKSLGGFSLWSRGGREVVGGFAWFSWFCFWRARRFASFISDFGAFLPRNPNFYSSRHRWVSSRLEH